MTEDDDAADRARFARWARGAKKDPSDVLSVVRDARVVGLGECEHLCAQPLEFRNRLVRELVGHKGFTVVALETGVVEARIVHEYVSGIAGDLDLVLEEGFSWTFGTIAQNRALIEWLRGWNLREGNRKVSFYGFDVPGSPAVAGVARGTDFALSSALGFVCAVDPDAGEPLRTRLRPLLQQLRFDLRRPAANPGYERLAQAERDALTAAIADLLMLLERKEHEYSERSTRDDWDWSRQAAIGARQLDGWLRQVPLGYEAREEQFIFMDAATDIRERAQAENLEWILRREGPDAKAVVFAHNNHLSGATLTKRWERAGAPVLRSHIRTPAGVFLRRLLGGHLVTIASVAGGGEVGRGTARRNFAAPDTDAIDGLAREAGGGEFLLDIREVPSELKAWLGKERQLGRGGEYPGSRIRFSTRLLDAFDALFYVERVEPIR